MAGVQYCRHKKHGYRSKNSVIEALRREYLAMAKELEAYKSPVIEVEIEEEVEEVEEKPKAS